MHSTEIPNGSVPAFLTKLWRLVEDTKYDDLICWTSNGQSFIIHHQSRFAKELLPLYFKHNNMASFIRQLNMYGFRKVVKIDQGGLHLDASMEFHHQFFSKGQETLLVFIKRKVANSRAMPVEEVRVKPEAVEEMISDVKALRGKQESVDNLLSNMKRENEALWREVAFLRQKHLKQQQIVEKLIQFLVTLVQPNGVNLGVVKRKVPLLLYNNAASGPTEAKLPRLSRQISSTVVNPSSSSTGPVIHDITDALDPKPLFSNDLSDKFEGEALLNDTLFSNAMSSSVHQEDTSSSLQSPAPENQPLINSPAGITSPLGTEDTLEPLSILVPLETAPNEEMINNQMVVPSLITPEPTSQLEFLRNNNFELNLKSPDPVLETGPTAESLNTPQVEFMSILPEAAKEIGLDNQNSRDEEGITLFSDDNKMQVALSDSSTHFPYRKRTLSDFERSQFADHLEVIETELDSLQDQFSGSLFNFDVSSLLTLFDSDDTVPGNNLPYDSLKFNNGGVTGNEVVQYLPTLQDELIQNDSEDTSTSVYQLETINSISDASTSVSSFLPAETIDSLVAATNGNNKRIAMETKVASQAGHKNKTKKTVDSSTCQEN